jgi:hypothetical protein
MGQHGKAHHVPPALSERPVGLDGSFNHPRVQQAIDTRLLSTPYFREDVGTFLIVVVVIVVIVMGRHVATVRLHRGRPLQTLPRVGAAVDQGRVRRVVH